ncbi:MAG: hypothetical protein FWF84_04685, partial [Kiritimatiellaeota bacterium]|nr:hypothetical protein [Kiritimatiellota bacterium]
RVVAVDDGVTQTWYEYDLVGNVTQETATGRSAVEYGYDATNNRISATQGTAALGWTYDAVGNAVSFTDAEGGTTTFAYDAANRLVSETNHLGETTVYGYDPLGRASRRETADGLVTGRGYNLAGDVVESADGPGGSIRYQYDDAGRPTEMTDALNRTRTAAYDALGLVVRTENALGEAVEYAYDAAGQRLSLTDGKNQATLYEYDADSRLTATEYPNSDREEYEYDGSGLLVKKTAPDGKEIDYGYDVAGNLSSVFFDNRTVSFAAGSVTSISDALTVMGYVYDPSGRLTSASDQALGIALDYGYDAANRRISMAGNLPEAIQYAYDAAGRLSSVTKGNDNPALYGYDAGGKRTSLTLPNGVNIQYSYDDAGRLAGIAAADGGGTVLDAVEYGYDAAGQRTSASWAVSGETANYEYDLAGRLTREVRIDLQQAVVYEREYGYDAVGNRISETAISGGATETALYTYNSANQLTAIARETNSVPSGSTLYSYDPNGNCVRIEKRDAQGTALEVEELGYDSLGRQVSWTDGTRVETTAYRGVSWHRHSVTVDDGTATTTTAFVHDGDDVVLDLIGTVGGGGMAWSPAAQYVTPFLDENLSATLYPQGWTDALPVPPTHYYTHDALSSVRTLTDNAGNVVNRYDYEAFGKPHVPGTSVTVSQRYGFQGREREALQSRMHYRTRTYAPELGLMLNRSPWGYNHDRPSLYDAMNQNPVMYTEPFSFLGGGGAGFGPYNGPSQFFPLAQSNPSNSIHFERNQYNRCPANEPCIPGPATPGTPYTDHEGGVWEKEGWNPLHWGRQCYRGTGGNTGSQCCYFPDGTLDDRTPMMGTYDFVPPRGLGYIGHILVDVFPHFHLGGAYTPGLTEVF